MNKPAQRYLTMHSARLASFSITDIRGKIFEIIEALSTINNGPIQK
ncbi:YdhR family protein [Psychrobacillus sp. FSL K6-2836]